LIYLAFDRLVFTQKALPKRPVQAAQQASELALGMGIRNFAVQVAKQSYSTYSCEKSAYQPGHVHQSALFARKPSTHNLRHKVGLSAQTISHTHNRMESGHVSQVSQVSEHCHRSVSLTT